MPPPPTSFVREGLLDPTFWGPRIGRLDAAPRRLLVVPRGELARPGTEVREVRLRAHDGERLSFLLATPAFPPAESPEVWIRITQEEPERALDWGAIERGVSDLVVSFAPDRRLEDRVLDVLAVARAARKLDPLQDSRITCRGDGCPGHDELLLAQLLRTRGLS